MTRLISWAQKQRISKALIYSVLAKTSSAIFGLITIMIAGILLKPDQQGYFVTFLSLASTYMLVELGLGSTIIQFASHEVASMESAVAPEDRKIARSRLVSIGRLGLRWFGWGAVAYVIVMGAGGLVYFHGEPGAENLRGPWLFLSSMVAIDILMMPLWFLLEGANEVVEVYRYRAVRMGLLGMGTAATMACGSGPWALGVGYMLTIPWSAYIILVRKREFFALLLERPNGPRVNWLHEMLPYQGRLLISTICTYLVTWLPALIALKIFGPAVAGQIGITWSAMSGVSVLAGAVIAVKIPLFGRYVAMHRFGDLDRALLKVTKASMGMAAAVAGGVVVFVAIMNYLGLPFAHRILAIQVIIPAMIACTFVQFLQPMQAYLRAFKREPFVWVSLSLAIVGIPCMVLGGKIAGPSGFVAGYMGVAVFFSLPFGIVIFLRQRRKWTQSTAQTS